MKTKAMTSILALAVVTVTVALAKNDSTCSCGRTSSQVLTAIERHSSAG